MLCKIDSVPIDVLVKLVSENFTDEEVEAAKSLLCEHVDESVRIVVTRRGQNKKKMNLDDIVKMLIECKREELPKFVALNLGKLPPISVDCIDVSALMRKQQLMDVEMSSMKSMIQDILRVTADTSKRVEEVAAQKSASARSTTAAPATSTGPSQSSQPMTYAEVVQTAPEPDDAADGGWSIANSAKKAKPPARRRLVAESGAVPPAAAPVTGVRSSKPAKSSAVIGTKAAGPIKAVATVRRVSLFMSRLPPGTGEEAVSAYVREQSGAEMVSVEKLQTRFDSYESYRLEIVNPPAEVNLLDPDLWAQGLVVRRFFQKRNTTGSVSGGSK